MTRPIPPVGPGSAPRNGVLWQSLDTNTPRPLALSAICGQSEVVGAGVWGLNDSTGTGVLGESKQGIGVSGASTQGIGVSGDSSENEGVRGVSHVQGHAGVTGENVGGGPGIYAHGGNAPYSGKQFQGAALFDGDVHVNGSHHATVDFVLGADCAEEFNVAGVQEIEPGTVMVLDAHGGLQPSEQPYDRKVAGVVSGAGDCRPGLILGSKECSEVRALVALAGKVYCKVDAQYAPIGVGDLLTTSSTAGHAMRAADPLQAFGAVIGKALGPLPHGQGLIPILVALQ